MTNANTNAPMPPESTGSDHDHNLPDERGQTASDLVSENKIAGLDRNWNTDAEWDGHDYNAVPIPHDRPMPEWDPEERRAWLLAKLREYGTWRNVPLDQESVADDFGVCQQSISHDLKELRRYIRFHAGNKAVSMTEMVAQRAVAELQEDEDWFKALQAQLDYNEFLFELGRLERAPDKKQVQSVNVDADASDLTGEEAGHFEDLADMVSGGQSNSGADDVIDVDSEEVEDDD